MLNSSSASAPVEMLTVDKLNPNLTRANFFAKVLKIDEYEDIKKVKGKKNLPAKKPKKLVTLADATAKVSVIVLSEMMEGIKVGDVLQLLNIAVQIVREHVKVQCDGGSTLKKCNGKGEGIVIWS